MATEYAVIGAGQFGTAVAQHLTQQGQSVLVIDKDERLVQGVAAEVHSALVADTTDEKTLMDLGLATISTAVVAIGNESIEASILTTALLRQIGVPRIIARAANTLHARVLRSVGAHEVLSPEEEIGKRLAMRLVRPSIKEQLDFGDAILAEVDVPEKLVGQTLQELDIRNRFAVNVVAVRRGERAIANPSASEMLQTGDVMIILGEPKAVHRIASLT